MIKVDLWVQLIYSHFTVAYGAFPTLTHILGWILEHTLT